VGVVLLLDVLLDLLVLSQKSTDISAALDRKKIFTSETSRKNF